MEAYCKGGQGPPRAVAPPKKKNTYPEYVFVASGIQHAMSLRNIIMCGLSDSAVFAYIILQTEILKKKNVIAYEMCVLVFSTTFV